MNELTIYLSDRWAEMADQLRAKGHTVILFSMVCTEPADLILHEAACRWTDDLWPHIDIALKEARRAKKARTPKDATAPDTAPRKQRGHRKGSPGATRE